jgi:hypothetical protein
MYHDRTAWRCAFYVGKKYGCSKGYPQRNAAHMGSISAALNIYLRTNSDLCHLQHKVIGFYNRHEKCLQRGTDWVFK